MAGKWKLILPHRYRTLAGKEGGTGGIPVPYSNVNSGMELYNLADDIGEQNDLASNYPEVVKRLQNYAAKARKDLGDNLTKTKGSGTREPGKVEKK